MITSGIMDNVKYQFTFKLIYHSNLNYSGVITPVPFLKFWGRYEPGEVFAWIVHPALPPVRILLGDDLDDVTGFEFKAGLFAWDELVLGRVVVELSPHVHLE